MQNLQHVSDKSRILYIFNKIVSHYNLIQMICILYIANNLFLINPQFVTFFCGFILITVLFSFLLQQSPHHNFSKKKKEKKVLEFHG